jgi:hypothetical protein
MTDTRQDSPTGPANPHPIPAPDAPTVSGGPRAGGGSSRPGEPDEDPTTAEPEVHPSSLPDGPQTIPVPPSRRDPTSDGETHPRTQAEQANEQLRLENAETSLDQPSDGSGGE